MISQYDSSIACNHSEFLRGAQRRPFEMGVQCPDPLWQPPEETRQTFADAPLPGNRDRFCLPSPIGQTPRGYGLDLDGDGKFNPRKDGYLSFDLNGDDRHCDAEISRSRDILKSFSGDFDSNGDGKISRREEMEGKRLAKMAGKMDLDRDGILSSWELQMAGASVVTKPGRRLGGNDEQRTCVMPNDYSQNLYSGYSGYGGYGGGCGGFGGGGFGGAGFGGGSYGGGGFGFGGQGWQSHSLSDLPYGGQLDFLNLAQQTYQLSY